MITEEEIKSHYQNVYTVVRDTFRQVKEIVQLEEFPNLFQMDDAEYFNVTINLDQHDYIMNFNIYKCNDIEYMLELTNFFKQPNKVYPEGFNEEEANFVIQGAPLLGAHVVNKPIAGNNLYEARLLAIDYVDEHLASIVQEALGAADLL